MTSVLLTLRERTDAALKRKADEKQKKIDAQVKDFFAAMEPIADKGLCDGEYRGGLCIEAIEILEAKGVEIYCCGEGCNLWKVKW